MFEVKDKGVPCKNIKSTIQKIRSLLPANQSIRTSTHFNQIIHPCPSIQANHPIHTVWKLWKFSLTLFYQIKIRESDDFTKEVTGDLISRNIFFDREFLLFPHCEPIIQANPCIMVRLGRPCQIHSMWTCNFR